MKKKSGKRKSIVKNLKAKKGAAKAVKGGRITNLRANVSGVGASSSLIPSQI